MLRRDLDQQIGEPEGSGVCRHCRRGEGDLASLLGGDINQLVNSMSEVDGEDTGQSVDIRFSKNIGDPDALAFLKNQRILAKRLHLREVDHDLRGVEGRFLSHGSSPPEWRSPYLVATA